ncbi:hypothetical protein D1871_23015 [Nakamurella silvestris]|nr:hypothetical protein D1871_23015 [Nakamurella silvestris]
MVALMILAALVIIAAFVVARAIARRSQSRDEQVLAARRRLVASDAEHRLRENTRETIAAMSEVIRRAQR